MSHTATSSQVRSFIAVWWTTGRKQTDPRLETFKEEARPMKLLTDDEEADVLVLLGVEMKRDLFKS